MCSNYEPVTSADRLLAHFGAKHEDEAPVVEAWPLSKAPFIRLAEDGSGNRVCLNGQYGLLPHFATELAYGRKTYNARSETVAKLASFRQAWARSALHHPGRADLRAELGDWQGSALGHPASWASADGHRGNLPALEGA